MGFSDLISPPVVSIPPSCLARVKGSVAAAAGGGPFRPHFSTYYINYTELSGLDKRSVGAAAAVGLFRACLSTGCINSAELCGPGQA